MGGWMNEWMEDMGASFLGMKAVVVPCSSGQVTIFIVKCLLAIIISCSCKLGPPEHANDL